MGINAVKAVEVGAGVKVAQQRGSEHRDELTPAGFLREAVALGGDPRAAKTWPCVFP
jgi:chorismate synthase